MAEPTPEQIKDVCGDPADWVCERAYRLTDNDTWARVAEWVVAKPLTIAFIVVVAAIATWIAHRAVDRFIVRVTSTDDRTSGRLPSGLMGSSDRREARAHTLASVLRSMSTVVVWIIAVFAMFGVLEINLGPLIAGAGIAGIAIGFGAQSFVRDVVTGIFMLIEDQYGVGDIVDLGEATGTVEKVSIRSTRLRDVYGVVWYVPNGEIRRVANKSQEWARALLDVTVGYDADVEEASRVIRETADAVSAEPAWSGEVLEPPDVWGVESFGPDGIAIRLVIKTRPASQFGLMRELRGRLKVALDAAGIPLAHEQAMRIQVRTPGTTDDGSGIGAGGGPLAPAVPDQGASADTGANATRGSESDPAEG